MTNLKIEGVELRRQENSEEQDDRYIVCEVRRAFPLERRPVVRRELAKHSSGLSSDPASLLEATPCISLQRYEIRRGHPTNEAVRLSNGIGYLDFEVLTCFHACMGGKVSKSPKAPCGASSHLSMIASTYLDTCQASYRPRHREPTGDRLIVSRRPSAIDTGGRIRTWSHQH